VQKIFNLKERQKSTHKCYFCSREWNSPSDLAIHMLCHTRERPYKCPFMKCKKFSRGTQTRNQHALICNYNPNLRKNLLQRESRNVLMKCKFQCYFCHQNFTSKISLFRHIKKHTEELKMACFGCKVQFHYRDVWKHRKTFVKNQQIFKCPFCHCSRTSSGQLNAHIQTWHTKDNVKTMCYFCNISFSKDRIREHLATDTKEKAHKCPHCKLSYAQHGNLMSHIAFKHRKTEQGKERRKLLRRKCYFCRQYFATYGCLRKHLVCHTMETFRGRNS